MKLTRADLFSLEQYSDMRKDYRQQVMAHKADRHIPIGPNATLYFEDRMTVQYQIQEMLRIEKIFDANGINEELETYNPMIPDGSNWKATFMIEFPDESVRREKLAQFIGIEKAVWVRVGQHSKVNPICNEDLERETEDKTSAVHFMRFELSSEMIAALSAGEAISMGCDLPVYTQELNPISEASQASLTADLELVSSNQLH